MVTLIMLPLLLLPVMGFGQTIAVRGSVKDNSGAPIPGASVVVRGTSQVAVTDLDGNYSLKEVDPNGILYFSFIGMRTLETPVNGRQVIDVVLELDVSQLEEVVVVGYGTQRKEAVTGSVASVQGDVMREVASSNITRALQGRIAGVEMSQTSSKPGSALQIRIRGTRSLNASNDPLIVLDGIPFSGSISDINPGNIKSIDILKDASATAIYGSRGANGVLLITTEKGYVGLKARVTYDGYVGLNTVFNPYPMMDNKEFVALRSAVGMYTNGVDEDDNVNIDWQDLLYKNGVVTSHNVGVTGGTQKGNYTFGAGYYRDEAVLPGQDYTRITLNGSLDQQIGKYFRFGFSTNNNFSVSNGDNLGIYGNLSASPIANPYNDDGTLKRTVRMPLDENWVTTRESVDALGDKWIDQNKAFGSYNNIFAEVKIPGVEGLKYRANLGLDFRTSSRGSYTGEGVFSSTPTTESTASITNSLTTHWLIENILSYDRTFADKHQLNVVALYSAEQEHSNSSNIAVKDIPSDAFNYYNLCHSNFDITINPAYQNY